MTKRKVTSTKTIDGRKHRFDIVERYDVFEDQTYYDVIINKMLWCSCPDLSQAIITAELLKNNLHGFELMFV